MADVAPVGVVIATYGELEDWAPIADAAQASVDNQTMPAAEIVWVHGNTLSEARNLGAEMARTKWLIFLDADDELDDEYIEAMMLSAPLGDLHQPATLGVHPDGFTDDAPVLIPPNPGGMLVGNHLVIGTMIRSELFFTVGGFRDLPVLEDWDLWIRCLIAGATVSTCPDAIYRVTVNPDSRNQNSVVHGRTYVEIQQRYAGQL